MPELLSAEIIAEAKSMMKDKFPKMIEYFLEDSATYAGQIEEGFKNNDVEAVIPPSHTLSSSSRQMGAILLSEIAMDIELTSREIVNGNGDLSCIKDKISEIKNTLKKTHEAYKEYQ